MDKHAISRPPALAIASLVPETRAIQALSPLDATYTAHREAARRQRATQEWLREREALQGRRF